MNPYWGVSAGFLFWIQVIAGSVVAPIVIVRMMFALIMPTDPFPWNFVVPFLFGCANLTLTRQPVPWGCRGCVCRCVVFRSSQRDLIYRVSFLRLMSVSLLPGIEEFERDRFGNRGW
jgi:hypothetical protein